jgi:hypothetical protein
MPLLLAALMLAAVAYATAPDNRASDDLDPTPWPPAAVRVAALGRSSAAADVAWLKTVQLLGSDAQAAAGYPELEKWIDLITTLDPRFEEPYFFGATLLVTDPERAPQIDALLERGEQVFPGLFHFAMLRGFLAQFGLLDATKASEHYRRASTMRVRAAARSWPTSSSSRPPRRARKRPPSPSNAAPSSSIASLR